MCLKWKHMTAGGLRKRQMQNRDYSDSKCFLLRRIDFMHHPRCAHSRVAFAKLLSLKVKILQASLCFSLYHGTCFCFPPLQATLLCCVFLAEMVSSMAPRWQKSFVAACNLFLLLDTHVPSSLAELPRQGSDSFLWIMYLRRTWKWKLR